MHIGFVSHGVIFQSRRAAQQREKLHHIIIYENFSKKNPYLISRHTCPDIEAPFYLFGIRIDLITYYLGACGLSTCVFYGTKKSLQRFLALSAPLFYDQYLTMKNTIKVCIIYAVIIHIGFLPILINKSIVFWSNISI